MTATSRVSTSPASRSVLLDNGLNEAEEISRKIKLAFIEYSNWLRSEKELRELRKEITFAIFSQEDDLDKVAGIVDHLLNLLRKTREI